MIDDKTKLKTLTRVDDEANGSIIVSVLKDAGIKATLTGVFTAGFRAEAPGYVSVVVSEKDLAKAKKILQSIELETPVDWSKVDVGEPED
ncbi:MAG: putative signal transducing protein [Pirellulaceae bacterium]